MEMGIDLNVKASKVVLNFNKRKNTIEISQIVPVEEKIADFGLDDHPHILEVFGVRDIEYIIRPKKPEIKKQASKQSIKKVEKIPTKTKKSRVKKAG